MVTSTPVIFVVVMPVAPRPAALMVVAVTLRPVAIGARVMPFSFTAMALFPLSTRPITMPVIVPVAVPARTNNNDTRRFGIHRRGRSVDRLRRTGDANVYSDIDVCEGD
jgi:hypothetical protein